MELDTQERKRQDSTVINFKVQSSISTTTTNYSLIQQKWLVKEQNRKVDSIDGIGPFRLVRNKISYAAFKESRMVYYPEQIDPKTQKKIPAREVAHDGLIVFAGGNSTNVLIQDWIDPIKLKKCLIEGGDTPFTEKNLAIQQHPTAYDFSLFLSEPQQDEKKTYQPQLQCIMGCSQGFIYVFDPLLMGDGKITKYYHAKPPCQKRRRVEIVKWFEPLSEKENSNKFIVVYEDGTIYVFYVKKDEDQKAAKPLQIDGKDVSVEKIVSTMQDAVENYDFNKHYAQNQESSSEHFQLIAQENVQLINCISSTTNIFTNRACNITVANFMHGIKDDVNPYLIFRFDCRQINDLVSFRVSQSKKEHWIVAACNDGYLKVFSPQQVCVVKVIKGMSGNPICMDVSGLGHRASLHEQRDMLAVGYEDDSFVVYSIQKDFQPMFRGIGHRAFIGQIKFDNYFIDAQRKMADQSQFDDLVAQEDQSINRSSTILSKIRHRSSQQLQSQSSSEMEYRIITCGEDGNIMWWNIKTAFNQQAFVTAANFDAKKPAVVYVKEQKSLIVVRPVYQIHLSESGQFYALIIGPSSLVLAQNDCILSFYNVEYSKPKVAPTVTKSNDNLEIDIQIEHQAAIEQQEEVKKEGVFDLNKHARATKGRQPAIDQRAEDNSDVQVSDEDVVVPNTSMPPNMAVQKNNLSQ